MSAVSMDPRIRARRVEVRRLAGRRRRRVLVALVVGTGVVVGAWLTLTRTPLFDVDEIRVMGASHTGVDAILESAGIDRGEPLVDVDIDGAKDAVAQLPWVAEVRGDRSLGGTVTLAVTERTAVAAVAGEAGWLVVDGDGRVLEVLDRFEEDLIVIDGTRWNVTAGGWVGEGVLDAIDLATTLPSGLASKVASITDVDSELELVLLSGGRVAIGSLDRLDEKFLATLTVLAQVNLRCLATLDVRAPTVPVLTRLPDCS